MWTIFKVIIEFVKILLVSWFFFGYEACGILAPQPRTELVPSALESEILITRLPGKSHGSVFIERYVWGKTGEHIYHKALIQISF